MSDVKSLVRSGDEGDQVRTRGIPQFVNVARAIAGEMARGRPEEQPPPLDFTPELKAALAAASAKEEERTARKKAEAAAAAKADKEEDTA